MGDHDIRCVPGKCVPCDGGVVGRCGRRSPTQGTATRALCVIVWYEVSCGHLAKDLGLIVAVNISLLLGSLRVRFVTMARYSHQLHPFVLHACAHGKTYINVGAFLAGLGGCTLGHYPVVNVLCDPVASNCHADGGSQHLGSVGLLWGSDPCNDAERSFGDGGSCHFTSVTRDFCIPEIAIEMQRRAGWM